MTSLPSARGLVLDFNDQTIHRRLYDILFNHALNLKAINEYAIYACTKHWIRIEHTNLIPVFSACVAYLVELSGVRDDNRPAI